MLVYPIFVCPGDGVKEEISSMPGQYQLSVDQAVERAMEVERAGLGGLMVFGLPESKDPMTKFPAGIGASASPTTGMVHFCPG
jgi:delta-aminolevulinic acid dehydratase/porphobilinogen synthase